MNCANHPNQERVAFCQNCGKPLCRECTRPVGSAVYCEPCLAARLGNTVPGAPAPGFGTPVPPPSMPGEPSPVLATILGFIPGVGAMYNGQFAKGIVHVLIFVFLVVLASDVNGIFGLLIAGWEFYMAFEAHHTAKARRDGTPLPNPFGLNDVGERLGFGKAWTGTNASAAPGAVSSADYAATAPPPPAGTWGAPYTYPPPPPIPVVPLPPVDPNAFHNRFPAGAIWLIGAGVFFLFTSTDMFGSWRHHMWPFFLIGLGAWMFFRRMQCSGTGLSDDHSATYRWRVVRALRGSAWVILLGVMCLLNEWNIMRWHRSWPLWIIMAGVLALAERTAWSHAAAENYGAPAATVPPAGTSIVPTTHENEEGR